MKTKRYTGKKYKNAWTKERRKKQAENCRQSKPWEHTTGPKTAEGKKRVSQNALTHGGTTKSMLNLHKALHMQSLFLKQLEEKLKQW